MAEYNDQMKAEIQVTRRATYKAEEPWSFDALLLFSEDHIKQMEEVKSKQDLLIDTMNEDIKRLTQRKAGISHGQSLATRPCWTRRSRPNGKRPRPLWPPCGRLRGRWNPSISRSAAVQFKAP